MEILFEIWELSSHVPCDEVDPSQHRKEDRYYVAFRKNRIFFVIIIITYGIQKVIGTYVLFISGQFDLPETFSRTRHFCLDVVPLGILRNLRREGENMRGYIAVTPHSGE